MDDQSAKELLVASSLAGLLVALILFGYRSNRKRERLVLQKWAEENRFEILSCRQLIAFAFASVLIAVICGARGAVIALPNPSFESPDFADGTGQMYITPGIAFAWNLTGPVNQTQFGILDPNDLHFLGTTGNGTNRLPAPADGYQYAFLGGSAQSVTCIQTPGAVATIQPFTRYTLDIAAINEYAQNSGSRLGTLQLSLLAGQDSLAASSLSYDTFDFGQIRLLETSFTTGDSTDPRVGQHLSVRVTYTADTYYGSNGFFDNVVLTATPIPEPTSFTLVLFGSVLGLHIRHAHRGKHYP